MSEIVVVDDDYASGILVDNLTFLGHDVVRFRSADEALTDIEHTTNSDLIILDIIMEPPASRTDPGVSGGRNAGMEIYRQVRARRPDLPIIVYSASNEPDITDVLSCDPHAQYIHKWDTPRLRDITSRVQGMLGLDDGLPPPKVFIVHGHDDHAKLEVKNYLQNSLNIGEPIVLHEQPSLGRTIIEKFEDYSADAQLAFVILTPDDLTATAGTGDDEKRRARQNVIFELGYFLGALGRASGRVVLLHKGPLDLPSDIKGVIYVDISNGVETAGEQIRRELAHVLK